MFAFLEHPIDSYGHDLDLQDQKVILQIKIVI